MNVLKIFSQGVKIKFLEEGQKMKQYFDKMSQKNTGLPKKTCLFDQIRNF